MNSKLTQLCEGFLEAGWLVALIAIPLFFNIQSERVFEPDKVTILRSLAVVMFFVWSVRFVDQAGWRHARRLSWTEEDSLWRAPFVLPMAVLMLVYVAASLFSLTPRASWFGSYQRLQGTYTTFSYIVIFAIMAATITSRVQIQRVVTAVIITSIPVAFYGLLQHFGLDPLPWGGDVTRRVAGHMGNAIFIAAYLIMALPLTLARIVDSFSNILNDEELSGADVVRAAVYIFVLSMQLLTIYWSGSRGPLIGLAAGLFSFTLVLLVSLRNSSADGKRIRAKDILAACVLLAPPLLALVFSNVLASATSPAFAFGVFFGAILLSTVAIFVLFALRHGWMWLWLSWLLLALVVAGWLLLFNVPSPRLKALAETPLVGHIFEAQLTWKDLPTIGSYGRMLDPSQTVGREKSNRVRVLIAEGVVDLISPHPPITFPDGSSDRFNFLRPLIGYGPESMYAVYNRFYPSELATVEARNASPDRSHNETFDALVITGLAGLLAWQFLYISVFYYGFSYLGVVRTRRDRRILLLAWIGGGLLGAALSFTAVNIIYLGVAIPTGTIVGLILYLFYYAVTAHPSSETPQIAGQPRSAFGIDHLLVNAVLAAVLAHYVEIHFGIAIAATRLHFFAYVAVLFVMVYNLPGLQAQYKDQPTQRRNRSGQARATTREGHRRPWIGIWPWVFLLALLLGILGAQFINYTLPPDKVVQSGADLSALDIFNQSLFVNVQQGYVESPFVFLMIALSWTLGVLIILTEIVRYHDQAFAVTIMTPLQEWRRWLATASLLLLGLAGVLQRFLGPPVSSPREALGQNLALLGAVAALWAGWQLARNRENSRWYAVTVALTGLTCTLPMAIAGSGVVAVTLAASCLLVLLLQWDPQLRPYILPPFIFAVSSLGIATVYIFVQAVLLREALLYLVFVQGFEPLSTLYTMFFSPATAITAVTQARVAEAGQSAHFLTGFYLFMFAMMAAAGVVLAGPMLKQAPRKSAPAAIGVAALAVILASLLVWRSNVQPVQADMVFKRARPYDDEATRQNDPASWDTAISIYEEALRLAPWEDYYYLFLGRAYLERSALVEDGADQAKLLQQAEKLLFEAQALNPLNTDHLANLARLNTRWAVAGNQEPEREKRLGLAEQYYQQALTSSPQNSIVRNEYARMMFELRRSCDSAIELYEESLTADPFFETTYFDYADILIACGSAQSDSSAQQTLYEAAAEILQLGLDLDPDRLRAWVQLGQLLQQAGQFEQALAATAVARTLGAEAALPTWNVDFLEGAIYRDMGELAQARALAEQALRNAPPELAAEIESFLDELESE